MVQLRQTLQCVHRSRVRFRGARFETLHQACSSLQLFCFLWDSWRDHWLLGLPLGCAGSGGGGGHLEGGPISYEATPSRFFPAEVIPTNHFLLSWGCACLLTLVHDPRPESPISKQEAGVSFSKDVPPQSPVCREILWRPHVKRVTCDAARASYPLQQPGVPADPVEAYRI